MKSKNVSDCHVWAEIYYLDSPTDYREYILKPVSQRRSAADEQFITRDNTGLFPWRAVAMFLGVLLAIVVYASV